MKIVFRLNYHTVPGESLWLKLASVLDGGRVRLEQVLPLRWINAGQWQVEIELHGSQAVGLEYIYQLRKEPSGVELDEWNGPRVATADPVAAEALLLRDTWRSAGTVDYAFETAAFRALLPARGHFSRPAIHANANHLVELRMAAVPERLVPCIIGSVAELGGWDRHMAVPMCEISANVWQAALYLPADWWIEYKFGLFDPQAGSAVALEDGENRTLESREIAPRQWTVVSDEGYRRDPSQLFRGAGVAIPVFSLRSHQSLGIGEFADLKPFADWAAGVGLRMIQVLPVNDTTSSHDWTDSYPYSAISAFALHPAYLRIGDLGYDMPPSFASGHEAARARLNALDQVDHEEVVKAKAGMTRAIFRKHGAQITAAAGFRAFLDENRGWLVPYAAFCVMRDEHGTADFSRWGAWARFDRDKVEAMASPDHAAWPELSYHIWLQYELDRQLRDAVSHLHAHGIILKGDLPIGIDRESADAWSAPQLFKMDTQAGAPPDAFAEKGQNWGFPTYDWEAMRADGYAWWRSRFAHLSRYFDAFRIDHILGFFRIWQIPADQVEGIMGWFDPALPLHVDDIRLRGIPFDYDRYCRPYIHGHFLDERFGETLDEALRHHLDDCGHGFYQLRDHVATQRRIVAHFEGVPDSPHAARLRGALMDCAGEVLFFEVPGSHGSLFHPRCSMHGTMSFHDLDHDVKCRLDDLYVDYFHRRHEGFWEARGYEKLPAMRRASPMLLCGEDLGMVPHCVPGVMRELGILSLEIQRMPKSSGFEYADPASAPYLSVVSPSTHDMPTLRAWWLEDSQATAHFAWQMLGVAFPPLELTTGLAVRIIHQHLESPAMWAVFPLQDLLAIDESLRHPNPEAERINIPAITPYYWRYRMHLGIEELAAADAFNAEVSRLLDACGRRGGSA
jgi:4-alpha-glucanotransferase